MVKYDKVEQILESLTAEEKDLVYRKIWHSYVEKDIKAFAVDEDIELTDEEVNRAADLYVYNDKYDCEQSYWENIQGVIDMAKEV